MKLKLKLALALTTVGISLFSPRFADVPNVTTQTEIVETTTTEVTEMPVLPTLDNRYYPSTGIVTDFDYKNDLVIYTDFSGNIWDFKGIEDWAKGDRVALIMDNMGTSSIYDDMPVCWRYCGWVY